ncbi:hypothetical protein [Mucilaginibacter aquariorum]|uniref:Uncharacterized protein n=1 Tax=Mucilaginibacter aquariorum TaxID=2967225 RepID=A0ABT1SZ76_9SPHI|nr:hypothetical protein [Mucilaginibacter aquariorum]MCQ6957656.1 hypothetical protein [Mucilaginibacter aquariorum]
MNPLQLLEPEERERYDYLQELFEAEFEETHLAYHISGILIYELLNLLAACGFLFDEFGFPESEDSRLFRYAITGTIAEYLKGE